jgi:hypothetical protein
MDGITRDSFSGFAKVRQGKWAESGKRGLTIASISVT